MNLDLTIKLPLPENMGSPRRASSTEPLSRRPVRSTRTQVATYNNAILAGTALHTPTKYLEKHQKNVLHGLLESMGGGKKKAGPCGLRKDANSTPTFEHAGKGKIRGARGVFVKKTKDVLAAVAASPKSSTVSQPSGPGTAPVYKGRLPLDKYWDEGTWRRFTNTAVVPLGTAVQCLGLKLSYGKTPFQHAAAQNLSRDIDAIATKLYAQSTADDLDTCAADPNYLDEELDLILDTHGPNIWSIDADRSQLLKSEEGSMYENDLVYEVDKDRKLLCLSLHRWVFVRAFELLRKYGGEEDVRKGVLEALEGAGDAENTMELGLGRKRKVPVHEQAVKKKKRVLAAPGGGGKYFMDEVIRESGREKPRRVVRAIAVNPQTAAFLEYVRNFGQPEFQEAALINDIERACPQIISPEPFDTDLDMAAWIKYRRTILKVRESHAITPSLDLSPITIRIKNSRLLTELRKARDSFITCEAWNAAAKVLEEGSGLISEHATEYGEQNAKLYGEVEDGLRRLKMELVRLGNDLVPGSGEWVVMGPSKCPIVLTKGEE